MHVKILELCLLIKSSSVAIIISCLCVYIVSMFLNESLLFYYWFIFPQLWICCIMFSFSDIETLAHSQRRLLALLAWQKELKRKDILVHAKAEWVYQKPWWFHLT